MHPPTLPSSAVAAQSSQASSNRTLVNVQKPSHYTRPSSSSLKCVLSALVVEQLLADASRAHYTSELADRWRAQPGGASSPTREGHREPPAARPLRPAWLGALHPGSRFVGRQTNADQSYSVTVDIQNVDLSASLVCGYLLIENLTSYCPALTTYFEGEIIGMPGRAGGEAPHSFLTRKWDADHDVDREHWGKFPAFAPHADTFNSDEFRYDASGEDCVFMRWKELFLVPNHRVKDILGASFAGFYYVCFDVRKRTISGLYYHKDSELFQSLELEHVPKQTSGSFEFR